MVKPLSWRPTNNLEKTSIAQFFAYRLRTMVPYQIRIFLVGSVASMTAHLYSDIDIRVFPSHRYGNIDPLGMVLQNLAQRMYYETGVWIDAKIRDRPPIPFPGKKIVEI
jgi:hypothetical protein